MQRRLFVLNLLLMALFVTLLLLSGWDWLERRSFALGLSRTFPRGSILLGEGASKGWVIRFPERMVGEEGLNTPLDTSPFLLDPPCPVTAWWSAPDRLRLVPNHPLPRARRFHLVAASPLHSVEGHAVPEDLTFIVETPSVRLDHVMVLNGEEEGECSAGYAALTFDLPLSAEDLAHHLRAEDKEGVPLSVRVEAVPENKGTVFKMVFTRSGKGKDALPLEEARLHITPGLLPRGGEVPLKRTLTRRVVFREPLVLERVDAEADQVHLRFNRQPALPGDGWIAVDPAVPVQVSRSWRGLDLLGSFEPGSVYTLELKEGFPGKGTHRTRSVLRQAFLVQDREPAVRFASGGQVLSARARPEIEISFVNLEACRVRVRTLYGNNAVAFAHRGWWHVPDESFGPWHEKTFVLGGPRNRWTAFQVPLGALLQGRTIGFHEVRIQGLDRRGAPVGVSVKRLIQVTDLGVTARIAPGWIAARVTGLAKGSGLEGVRIRVFSPTNQLLAEGYTAAEGVILLPCPPAGADRTPFLLEAVKGEDRSFLELKRYGMELLMEEGGVRPYLCGSVEAYVFMDRGILRPGEEVRAAVMVRDGTNRAAAGRTVKACWYDPAGRVVGEEPFTVPGSGLQVVRKSIPEYAPTGAWGLEIRCRDRVVGRGSFRVGAFVPDRIEVKVEPEEPLLRGAEGAVRVQASWLEGGPAARLPGRVRIRFDHETFHAPGFERFSFGPREPGVPPGALRPITFVLDTEGRARVRFPVPGNLSGEQVLRAGFEVEVEDPSGRPVRAAREAWVFPRAGVLGIRAHAWGAEVVLLDPEGRIRDASVPVEVSLEERWWNCQRKDLDGGRFTFESFVDRREQARKKVVLLHGRARVPFEGIEAPARGWRVLAACMGKARAEQEASAVPARPDRLRVTCANAPVEPGGTARLCLDAPFGGSAFVTLEGTKIHDVRVFSLSPGHTEIRLPLPGGLTLPNLYAVVTLTRGQAVKDAAPPFLAAGGVSIPLDLRAEKEAPLRLEVPEKVVPEGTVEVELTAPGATQAVVALVDEGVLGLTRHPDPDPFHWFMAPRFLDSEGADTRTLLYENPRFTPPPVRGGDGTLAAFIAARLRGTVSPLLRPVALFKGPVDLDGRGRGRVVFRLPPYEGRLRAMALVSGPEVTAGAAAPVRVSAPLGLRAAGPRMLAPGDRSVLVVSLANRTETPGRVTLAMEPFGGAGIGGEEGRPPRVVTLAPGERRDLEIPVTAGPGVGPQGVRIHARMGPMERRVEPSFSVRPPALFTRLRRAAYVEGNGEIRIPGRWEKGTVKARLHLGAEPEDGLLPVLSSLVHYPYGCVEQTASQGFALLACRALLPRLEPREVPLEFSAMVTVAVDRILTMQTVHGGLSAWPGEGREYPFGTVYGTEFLMEARAQGFPVPEGTLQDLLDRVEAIAAREGDPLLRCRAAELLARAGRRAGPWLTLFAEKVKEEWKEEREGICSVALGLGTLGRREEARALLHRLDPMGGVETRETSGVLRSALRSLAVELRARFLVDPAGDRTMEEAERLAAAVLEPGNLTTQEAAQALRALSAFYRGVATRKGRFPCRVSWPGGEVRVERPGWIPLSVEGGERLEIRSEGGIFCFLDLEGFRSDQGGGGARSMNLVRRFLDPETGKEAARFHKGGIYRVRLEGTLPLPASNVCITDLLPGGFEVEGGRRGFRVERWNGKKKRAVAGPAGRVEIRDDRVLVFPVGTLSKAFALEYPVRAVFPGTYTLPPAQVEVLYDPGRTATLAHGATVRIEGRDHEARR